MKDKIRTQRWSWSMRPLFFVTALLACPIASNAMDSDLVIADFESGDYGNWKLSGEAFGAVPATGTLFDQKAVTGFTGKGFASSCFKGDKAQGRLISPEFEIQRDYLQFLIGAGFRFPTQACMNLLVNGEILRSATGKPGSETLKYQQWNVKDLKGKRAHLEILDATSGPKGHILVDDIRQTDSSLVEANYDLVITKPYLQVPVKSGARKTAFEILDQGTLVRTFEVELATDGHPDWWASDDVTLLRGKKVSVRSIDAVPLAFTNKMVGLFQQTDVAVIGSDLYHETNRPQFHFTVRRGWNNDPNGLVYFNGEWHMFFQKIPYGLAVGDFRYMHWGHAVSPDLFHWTELPPAIYPIQSGIFSGGAFVDYGNKSGFGKGKEDVLIASYTGSGERIAIGTGRALELKDIAGNPVLKHSGRDPKIIRYEPQNKWVMIVYEEAEQTGYAFYDSKDLKSWRRMFVVEGGHECPEFFEMSVEGESVRKWVIYGAERRLAENGTPEGRFQRSSYMIGSFDGEQFTPETGFIKGLSGPNFYAAQTFSDAPGSRRILLGWLQSAVYPGMPFTQGITIPTEMTLRRTSEGLKMFFNPVREIEKLRRHTKEAKNLSIADANACFAKDSGELLDFDLTVSGSGSDDFTLSVRGNDIKWDAKSSELSCRGTKTKLTPMNGAIRIRVLVDRCVLELFLNDGVTGMTFSGNVFTNKDPVKLTANTNTRVQSLRISELKSIWKK